MYNPHDIICAISTPPGESALAIVRMSGRDAKNIAEKLLPGVELRDHQAIFGKIHDLSDGLIDEVVMIWYRGPRSYTGEDLVEVICHGGYVVSEQVLSLMLSSGGRLAEKGEFTLRAFLNGRLDLTEAEAVASVINAKTTRSKSLALNNLEGRLKTSLEKISKKLLDLITILEAEIDFGDDEVTKLDSLQIKEKVDEIETLLSGIISTYDIGRIAEGRARIAIVGAPNVGKSSLFNAILKTGRAIVTDIPGTTRDYLTEYVNIGGYPVMLTDTAGIHGSDEEIEQIGIERSKEIIHDSDLCIFVLDCSRPINNDDYQIYNLIDKQAIIDVLNKSDLRTGDSADNSIVFKLDKLLHTSAISGDGIDGLLELIKTKLIKTDSDISEGVLLSQRQYDCARKAIEALGQAKSIISGGETEEIYVGMLREALDQIGLLTGKITNDDILNDIFSRFCIGK